MIPPCHKAEGHTWEMIARCTVCGFLINLEGTYAPTRRVAHALRHALTVRFLQLLPVFLLALAVPAASQTPKVGIVATADVGKVYSVSEGRYVFASMPGAELSSGPVTVSGLLVITRATVIEADTTFTYARTRGRWTTTTSINHSRFFGLSYDWNWTTGIRVRVK